MATQTAFATNPHGGGAPAPEIGVGVMGAILSVAAVKYFRRLRS